MKVEKYQINFSYQNSDYIGLLINDVYAIGIEYSINCCESINCSFSEEELNIIGKVIKKVENNDETYTITFTDDTQLSISFNVSYYQSCGKTYLHKIICKHILTPFDFDDIYV